MSTSFFGILIFCAVVQGQREAASPVSHTDIRDAIITLANAIRETSSKLERHEARENLLGDSLTKMLNSIDTRTKGVEKNFEGMVRLVGALDEKIKKLESSMIQRDERERIQLQKILDVVGVSSGSGRTTALTTSASQDDSKQFARLMKKVDTFEKSVLSRLPMIGNEVKIVGEKMEARSGRMEQLLLEVKGINVDKQSADADRWKTAVAGLVASEAKLSKAIGDFDGVGARIANGTSSLSSQLSRLSNNTAAIQTSIQALHTSFDNVTSLNIGPAYSPIDPSELKEIDQNVKANIARLGNVEDMLMNNSKMLKDIEKMTSMELKDVKQMSKESVTTVAISLDKHMTELARKINDSQKIIHDQVSEAGDMAESLSERVEQGYKNISAEIRGLTNVEQVLLDTADSVMDTKRRLEYAVQQILMELGDTVRRQTGNLNEELTKRVDNVTLAVLGQQGTAWKNLTSKLESELGQVWRQIGVLHQTAIQSQSILDKMELQTVSHINGTLRTLANMDGKVLTVTTRMGEVEENLNYLLGRLSLVVQEFNQIRGGLGETLDSLRSNMAVIHEKIPETKRSRTKQDESENDLERRERK